MRGRRLELTGQKFGKLTVKRFAGTRIVGSSRTSFWLCECECGNLREVNGNKLKDGNSQSCGCNRSTTVMEKTKRAILGKKFGRLTVKELHEIKLLTYPSGTHQQQIWLCECECGNLHKVPTFRLMNGETKSCGCLLVDGPQKGFEQIEHSEDFSFAIEQLKRMDEEDIWEK